ncbi:MAG: PQQ-dependent sugar dehydrogenase [Phycisphaerales bacterium]|nr:PQQ-dependent sugar dehydrogenase [Phycisphaerales bacterium]
MNITLLLLAFSLWLPSPAPSSIPVEPAVKPIPDITLVPLWEHQFRRPVQAVVPPGDDSTIYVVEQPGRILAVERGASDAEPRVFMDVRPQVHDKHNEEGLLSLAFHPDYGTNRRIYVLYSAKQPRRGVLAEFAVSEDGQSVDVSSERVLLEVEQPWGNHNGSTVLFGPDGMLYVSFGDGGAANDPHGNGQDLSTLLGTVVRIDVDQKDEGLAYAIPPDNPFVGVEGARDEIWAYGLRNVWRMSFDRETGELWGGDVGQNAWEEIDVITRGGNYGWKPREGFEAFDLHRGEPDPDAAYIDPVVVYPREDGISVTGGYVQRGSLHPELEGIYFYGDYGSGRIWGLRWDGSKMTANREVFHRQAFFISSFGELDDGTILVCVFRNTFSGKGRVYAIQPARISGS